MLGFIIVLVCIATCQQNTDRVRGIIPEYKYPWYSGFLNATANKALHYVFFESQHDSSNDPILVWMGGRLGCSTLLGMVYENGPFIFQPNSTTYYLNNRSWTKHSSVLYIETPAPVGFSIGDNNNSDESVARDTLQALQHFFSIYPRYRSNDVYLSGSGYAGVSGPYLALEIYNYNQHPSTHSKMNLKGLLLGNPCTHPSQCYDPGLDGKSMYEYQFLYKHTFYSEQIYDRIKAICTLGWFGTACYEIRSTLDQEFRLTNTPSSNIYQKCFFQKDHYGDIQCEDTKGSQAFFNDPLIKQGLHVLETDRDWKYCNHEAGYKFKSNENASYPLYETLLKHYKIWIYSGDVSAHVPTTGTRQWIQRLRQQVNLPVVEPWRQWWLPGKYQNQDQVGGMVWKVKNLTLVTMKGTGFVAGKNNPAGLSLIVDKFLSGRDLPRKGQS